MAYDIFISYRRRDSNGVERGTFIASSIQQALHNRGYKERVFFDHEEIGPGKFEEIILNAIKQSKVFIFVLTKDSLLRCVDEDDWVRREICQAVESKLFIIFINPNGEFQENYPEGFPKELDVVKETNHIPIYVSSLNLHMDNLVEKYINPYIKKHNTQEDGAIVRIDTDLDCRVLLYGEQIGVAKVGEYTKMALPLGDNILKFVGLESDTDCDEQFITIENYHQKLIKVKLLDKYNTRRAKEKAERQRIEAERKTKEEAECKAKEKAERKAKEEAERKAKEEAKLIETEKRAKAKAEREAYLLSLPDNEFVLGRDGNKSVLKLESTGEYVRYLSYSYIESFSEGLAKVKLNDKCGYIDKIGREVISLKYDNAYPFREGLAAVRLNGKCGYINKTGKEVIPLMYDSIGYFREGKAKVKLNGETFYIDKNGNRIEE